MVHLAYLLPLLPLCGGAVLAVFGRRLGEPLAGWLGTATVGGSFVVTCIEFAALLGRHGPGGRTVVQVLWPWFHVGGLRVDVGLQVDPLSMTMALFVTGISTLIHLYSIGYMHGDRDFTKFFVYLNLFVASMLLLVLGDNLVLTFVGWEGVGACSYWLVAFWFERDTAASAGKKAFIYNRVGDVGFLLAIFLVFERTGSVTYTTVFAHLSAFGPASRTAVCLLLFLAAAGKSAQLPLFPWLADAMEGPTPVSALIHAATMVTAGVYLMCRISPILSLSHPAQLVVASVGVATAFIAATIGAVQNDIKKVLAYSTVSQLGYMFLAVGTGAYEAAIFLMLAHAFFKALLFLGAGSVIHGLHDEQDLKKMGNLRRYMKVTTFTFAVAWLAISGIPPLSGFWAKGAILDNAFVRFPALWAIGLVTAALTAYYLTRLVALAFFGQDRWQQVLQPSGGRGHQVSAVDPGHSPDPTHGADIGHGTAGGHHAPRPHESPWIMTLPLIVLAVLAFFGGALSLPWHPSFDPLAWLDPVFGRTLYHPHLTSSTQWALGITDTVVALIGLGVAFRLWSRRPEHPGLEPTVLRKGWYLDDITDRLIGRPGQLLARFSADTVDRTIIDGAVIAVARLTRGSGALLRRLQTGYVRQYALSIAVGTVALLIYMAVRAGVFH